MLGVKEGWQFSCLVIDIQKLLSNSETLAQDSLKAEKQKLAPSRYLGLLTNC